MIQSQINIQEDRLSDIVLGMSGQKKKVINYLPMMRLSLGLILNFKNAKLD